MNDNYGVDNPLEKKLRELERKERIQQRLEREKNKWNHWIAVTISVYAVLTAAAGMKENELATSSLLKMNEVVLLQSKATDQWVFFDEKSIKENILEWLMYILPVFEKPEMAVPIEKDFYQKLDLYVKEKKDIQTKAAELEDSRDLRMGAASTLIRQHHHAELSWVYLQTSIILASVSSLLGRKTFWFLSMGLALLGIVHLIPLFF